MQHNCPHFPGEVFSTVSTLATFVSLRSALIRLSSATLSTSPCSPCLCRGPTQTRQKGMHAPPWTLRGGPSFTLQCGAFSRPSPGSWTWREDGEGPEGPWRAGKKDMERQVQHLWAQSAKPLGFLSAGSMGHSGHLGACISLPWVDTGRLEYSFLPSFSRSSMIPAPFCWTFYFISECSWWTMCYLSVQSFSRVPVHHQLPELTQTHVHRVGDTIQTSHPLSSLSPPTFSLS